MPARTRAFAMPHHVVDPATANADFLLAHAAPARIGLAGGSAFIDRGIRRAQRPIAAADGSAWSHAFPFGETRSDGHCWVLESDLDLKPKQVRLGAQENRLDKYYGAAAWPNLAVLDFGLDAARSRQVLAAALELLARAAHYSLREILGTALAMARPSLRTRDNLLAREGALYCSAFVQHCYAAAGIDFVPGLALKNTTPHDIARSAVPHRAWTLQRAAGALR